MGARRRREPFVWLAVAAAGLVACAADAAVGGEAVQAADPRPLVAVAPLQDVSSASPSLPDPAARLAARLQAEGRVRVEGPAGLPHETDAAIAGLPPARSVRHWSADHGWDALLVGRRAAESTGEKVSLELRSGHSGAALARFAGTIEPGERGEAEVARLAQEIEAALGLRAQPEASSPEDGGGSGPAPVGAASAAEAAGAWAAPSGPAGEGKGGERKRRVAGLGSDGPIEIHADELDIEEHGGARLIHFRNNVRVRRDDVLLTTDALEAFYPKGDTQPERLVARGRVQVTQGDRAASCDDATYVRSASRITCTGRAELRQRCNVVRGREIVFDLDGNRVTVTGAASVVIHPEEEKAGGADSDSCSEARG